MKKLSIVIALLSIILAIYTRNVQFLGGLLLSFGLWIESPIYKKIATLSKN